MTSNGLAMKGNWGDEEARCILDNWILVEEGSACLERKTYCGASEKVEANSEFIKNINGNIMESRDIPFQLEQTLRCMYLLE